MSDFGTDFAAAAAALDEVLGDTVAYARGATTLSVTAVRSQTRYLSEGEPVRLDHVDPDYVLAVADLASLWPPAKGDRITDGAFVCEALAPAGGQVWEYLDLDRVWVLVHAKRVSA